MASWNRLTYHRRLFLWLLGYSALLTGCFTVFQYHREKEFKAAEVNSRLQLINTYILTELDEGRTPAEISLDEFHPFRDIRVSIISDKGGILYDNAAGSIRRTDHSDREEIRQALRHGSGYAVRRHSESTGSYYFYSATRSPRGYLVRTAVPYTVSLTALLQADYGFLWTMAAITLLMCTLGYFATRRVGQHIVRLSRFAEDVERGIKISDTQPFPRDELGNISSQIVRLYARLQQALADRDSQHRAALREQQEKQRIKKQLTNNINHELKTPVASIQICVETLLAHPELDERKRTEFLCRCLAGTERLRRLLADVSLVTRMDDGGAAIARGPVNLTDLIAETVTEKAPIALRRSIALENHVPAFPTLTVTQGNAPLLESVFSNLIDNAIAYSGGTRIRLDLVSAADGQIVLTVCDNGTGVAPEHLPRLFERFYRVDKGRSRAAGGTGLGLAIVKNAVAFHGGNITVENRSGGGLLFRITLPGSPQEESAAFHAQL